MGRVLANSPTEIKKINALLAKNIPSYRQAYSDRTAWLMACLSELAYIKFNPSVLTSKSTEFIKNNILKALNKNKLATLIKLLGILEYDHIEEKEKLELELSTLNIEILETFDSDGTQAILVSFGGSIVLAFRGTERDSIKDIKADIKAKTTQCETGGKIHSGFKEAFDAVALEIQNKIDEKDLKDKPLFITGHSLGGALATIAAKKLSHPGGGIAACYTFGSPRVGDDEWIVDIKTPIYRIVNAADCVTMLPPGDETITIISWVLKIISWIKIPYIASWLKSASRWIISNFGGYIHCGNMRYMTNCKRGQYNNVKLLYSVSKLRRIKGLLIKKLPWKKFLADHAIGIYRKKLMIIAESRNDIV